jgi:meiotic recombination protein SPO11
MSQSQQWSELARQQAPQPDVLQHPHVAAAVALLPAPHEDEEKEEVVVNEDTFYVYDPQNHTVPLDRATAISSEDDGDSSSSSVGEASPQTVIHRIEDLILHSVMEPLDRGDPPELEDSKRTFFHSTHCRNLTSVFLVASFCHDLLQSNRTTTTREVYYFFVTHFRNQQECDKAIWDLSASLQVPRSALGLAASPKGWFCGCLDLYSRQTGDLILNGREMDVHGMAITTQLTKHVLRSEDAKCILVIEKEGVYNRLSEDKFFLHYYPCILVTGKGFPDVATRQWVQHLQQSLQLPVYGLCDCNPYGISVLNTYHYDQVVRGGAKTRGRPPQQQQRRRRHLLQLQWMGLRPSQIADLDLPPTVFQQLTDMDKKRLHSLLDETHPFAQQYNSQRRMEELRSFEFKVELEALNWKGMDFLCQWVHTILIQHEQEQRAGSQDFQHII